MKGSFKNGTFPSLTGVIRFLIVLSGLNGLNSIVSVPYRGYSFFNWDRQPTLYSGVAKFPSLTGVIRFLINMDFKRFRDTNISFRPLQGLFVF